MKLQSLVIGVLVFSMIFVSFSIMTSELSDTYSWRTNSTMNDTVFNATTFDFASGIENDTKEIQNELQNASITSATAYETISTAGFKALKLTFGSLGFISSAFSGIGNLIGIPTFIIWTVITIFVIIVGYQVIAYIFKYGGT